MPDRLTIQLDARNARFQPREQVIAIVIHCLKTSAYARISRFWPHAAAAGVGILCDRSQALRQ
jgi:hypothetical protein